MKRDIFIVTFSLIMISFVNGQAPESFKYQTIVRNSTGEIIANQQVTLIMDILQGNINGQAVCTETFTITTNAYGLVNLEIGSQASETFSAIDWADGPYFLKVQLDGNIMGTSELLSVPYAIYSKRSGEFSPPILTHEEINAITSPVNGQLVLCSDCEQDGSGGLVVFKYGSWYKLSTTCLGPLAPTAAIHDTLQTEITWKWNAVSDAIGYKWNTINNYISAIDLGIDTSKTETGLLCNTSYIRFVWAYSANCVSEVAVLSQKTAVCDDILPCPGIPFVIYEGQTYNTTQIGSQCWLRENLNVGVIISGTSDQLDNSIIEKYCYDDLNANCDIYGGIYQWREMMDYSLTAGAKGICPEGWHVPTNEDWCTLLLFLDITVDCNAIGNTGTTVGYKMKSITGWDNDGNGSNESGFTAIPGGVRNSGYYEGLGWASDFWTSTPNTSPGAYYFVCGSNSPKIARYNSDLSSGHGLSVRCLKDE
jgi:uncharacterized protein (TIGR02145 family)